MRIYDDPGEQFEIMYMYTIYTWRANNDDLVYSRINRLI